MLMVRSFKNHEWSLLTSAASHSEAFALAPATMAKGIAEVLAAGFRICIVLSISTCGCAMQTGFFEFVRKDLGVMTARKTVKLLTHYS